MDLSPLFTDTAVVIHIIVYALIPILAVVITIIVFKNRKRKKLDISRKMSNDLRTSQDRRRVEREPELKKEPERRPSSEPKRDDNSRLR